MAFGTLKELQENEGKLGSCLVSLLNRFLRLVICEILIECGVVLVSVLHFQSMKYFAEKNNIDFNVQH